MHLRAVLCVAAVAVAVCNLSPVTAFPKGTHCGHDDPSVVAAHGLRSEPITSPQQYHNQTHIEVDVSSHRRRRRQLDSAETYSTGSFTSYLSIDEAADAGLTSKIRITLDWGQITSGDHVTGQAKPYQCTSVGEVIAYANPSDGDHTCTADDVVSSGGAKFALMQQRSQWAAQYLMDRLMVKPILSPDTVAIESGILSLFDSVTSPHTDTDLVIIMTARPSKRAGLAAFAQCFQSDQHGRCTVGRFNWIPRVLDVTKIDSLDVIASERHVALHEVIHVLGGMEPGKAFVNNATGVSYTAAERENTVFEVDNGEALVGASPSDAHYAKPTSYVTSPRVKAMVREHFDCPSMKGMPLEDVPLSGGHGSHWEARLMGPEVMSYGSGSGETYMSDLTFAYLEDTHQYRLAPGAAGGRLVDTTDISSEEELNRIEACNVTASTNTIDFFFGNDQTSSDYVPPPPRPVGSLRWGRLAGCDFVQQSAGGWPERYRCTLNGDQGCSPDNRMSAVCSIRANWEMPFTPFSVGDITTSTSISSCTGDCPLPEMFQYFDNDGAVAATESSFARAINTGGYSMSMDFAPVRIGYWNCQDPSASTNAVIEFDDGSQGNLTELGTDRAVELVADFGGQCHCPTCRCVISSLRKIGLNVDPTFPRLGLCYRTNCYQEDYLQIAVKDAFNGDLRWYKCPSTGGKLYIPGFSGALHCPDAADFCTHETITGEKFPETQPWQLWAILAVIFLPVLFLFFTCLCPCTRDCFVDHLKNWCGVYFFAPRKALKHRTGKRGCCNARDADDIKRQKPPKTWSNALCAMASILLLLGVAVMALLSYFYATDRLSLENNPHMLGISVLLVLLPFFGVIGSRKKSYGVSCVVITYFFVSMAVVAVMVFTALNLVVLSDNLESNVDNNWDFYEDALKGHYDETADRDVQVRQATDYLEDQIQIIMGFFFGVVFFYFLSMFFSGKIMKLHVLTAVLYMVLTKTNICIGVVLIGLGAAMTQTSILGAISNLEPVVGPVMYAIIGSGVYVFLSSVIGSCGARKFLDPKPNVVPSKSWVITYFVTSALLLLATLYGIGFCTDRADNAEQTVAEMTEDELSDLENARTREQLTEDLEFFYSSCAVMFSIFAVLLAIILVSTALLLKAGSKWVREKQHKGAAYGADPSPTSGVAPAQPVVLHEEGAGNGDGAAPGGGRGGGGGGGTDNVIFHGAEVTSAAQFEDDVEANGDVDRVGRRPDPAPAGHGAFAVPPPAAAAGGGGGGGAYGPPAGAYGGMSGGVPPGHHQQQQQQPPPQQYPPPGPAGAYAVPQHTAPYAGAMPNMGGGGGGGGAPPPGGYPPHVARSYPPGDAIGQPAPQAGPPPSTYAPLQY